MNEKKPVGSVIEAGKYVKEKANFIGRNAPILLNAAFHAYFYVNENVWHSLFWSKNWKKKSPVRRRSKTERWRKKANIKSRKKKEGYAKGIYLKAFLQVWLGGPTRLIERKVARKTCLLLVGSFVFTSQAALNFIR